MKNPFLLKEIKSKSGVLHFKRWGIKTPWFGIYVHGIYKADEEQHLHDHPWDYISVILSGHFTEGFKNPKYNIQPLISIRYKDCRPFKIVIRKAERFHKIHKIYSKAVYTLFFTGPERRNWGYDVEDEWIDNETYRKMKRSGAFKKQ